MCLWGCVEKHLFSIYLQILFVLIIFVSFFFKKKLFIRIFSLFVKLFFFPTNFFLRHSLFLRQMFFCTSFVEHFCFFFVTLLLVHDLFFHCLFCTELFLHYSAMCVNHESRWVVRATLAKTTQDGTGSKHGCCGERERETLLFDLMQTAVRRCGHETNKSCDYTLSVCSVSTVIRSVSQLRCQRVDDMRETWLETTPNRRNLKEQQHVG